MNSDRTDCQLGIIIPAYKSRFFSATLASIAAQTDRRFVVYVGDDASPDDIRSICRRYEREMPICYRRFEENLGRKSLARHWERCAALADQPWLWLFSDDDIMDQNCVGKFYETLATTGGSYQIYRFNTCTVDAEDHVIKVNPQHPDSESPMAFARERFLRTRESYAVEYIFSRKAFEAVGGFVDLPLAWCADDASWLRLGSGQGFKLIPEARVYWRKSNANLSSPRRELRMQKIQAASQYLNWFEEYSRHHFMLSQGISTEDLHRAQRRWFLTQLRAQAPYTVAEVWSMRALHNPFMTPWQLWKALWMRERKRSR